MELFIQTAEGDSLLLTVKSTQWSNDRSTLTFFTNNPLIIDESDLKMPFARRRRVLEGPAVLNSRTRMTMTENTKTAILPGYSESGDLALSYDLNGASFYSSYLKYHSNFLLEIIGTLFVLILFIKYSVKALVTVPESLNPGNIIPHVLAFKVGALLLFPTYLEYVQYCLGFMTADFPWAN